MLHRVGRLAIVSGLLLFGIGARAQGQWPTQSVLTPESEIRRNNWYSQRLRALGETPLGTLSTSSSSESYRFLKLQTFYRSISVRIDVEPNGNSTLTRRIASGNNAVASRPEHSSRMLTRQQTADYMTKLEQDHRWLLPIEETQPNGNERASDWIVEWVKAGKTEFFSGWQSPRGISQQQGLTLAIMMARRDFLKQEGGLLSRVFKWIGLVGLAIVLASPLLLILIHLSSTYGYLMVVAHYVPWRDNFGDMVMFRQQASVLDQAAGSGKDKTCAFPDNRSISIPEHTFAKRISISACSCFEIYKTGHWQRVKITSGDHFGEIVWACDPNIIPPFPPL